MFERTEYFVVDLDGTFYRCEQPIPGAADCLRRIEETGKNYCFFSNNSSHSVAQICALSGDGNALNIDFCYNKSDELIVSGNEPHGLPKKVREALPLYSLPLKGRVESLNVTAASAIAYYLFWSLPPKRT